MTKKWWTLSPEINMAASAPSPLASSVEKTNGAKLSRLLIDGGTLVLRKVFDRYHPPHRLARDLNTNYPILENLYHDKVLNGHQWDKLFPPGGAAPDSKEFDITLLFLLLTEICGLRAPRSGWHNKPNPKNTSLEANMARIKFYRNKLHSHITTTGVDTQEFSTLWREVSAPLIALGLGKGEIDRLKEEKSGEKNYLQALSEWVDSDEKIKSELKKINQSQTKIQQGFKKIQETADKTQLTVGEIRQTQIDDHKILQSLAGDVGKLQVGIDRVVEEVRRSHLKTEETVEDVRRQNDECGARTLEQYETLQESISERDWVESEETIKPQLKKINQKLQELQELVKKTIEIKDMNRDDEVLRNLAKSEFRTDIAFYVNRYQAGTREWVFDTVQHWLDDKNSQTRVMVISGKAGMGKSVIAAVICKRMQEAGRLSGSHFCQHNNVRYFKPQLMLQSLACHLSHALPEYKQALVQQLSRHLGTDLNNMGVEELFALLFKEPLSAVSDPERNMLMVIDGLDESEYQGRNELLDVIASQFCKLPIWIRFLVTTRPALNIAEKLKHLKPFELKSNHEKNFEDIRVFFLQRLGHLDKVENIPEFVERLVLKSDGFMLYAYFLILSIAQNTSAVLERDLDDSLPLGISSVCIYYFKHLERELVKELNIKEEHFLNMLSAITASREPLPVDFVSKVLVPSCNSPLAKRKILRALGSVSPLLPVRDDCVHVIHKSVKDWLTDTSCYGEHEFIMDENNGHCILAALCTDELDDLKRKGVHDEHFCATQRYALYHGTHHMVHEGVKREPHQLDELTKAYIIDLEIVFAKTCVSSTLAAEDLLWLKKHGISAMLSKDNQSVLDTLSFLLRKYLRRFTDTPGMFLQTILNQGGKVLSVESSNLLQNRYPEIPYMEDLYKETKQGSVVARFNCSTLVACLDVSPQLDYMVCECDDGMLRLWSLHTGGLAWTRPVITQKCYLNPTLGAVHREVLPPVVSACYRSVVFHPTKACVLPGILSQVYTMDGKLEPFFSGSNCRFSVCSISGDKTKMLTNCLENSKCLVLWSLQDGLEIDRILSDEDILSFAWSGDGRLLAISHSSGLICLFDVMHGFRKLAQAPTPNVCGLLKFSPDHQSLLFRFVRGWRSRPFFRLSVNKEANGTFSIKDAPLFCQDLQDFQSCNDCGFKYGDPIDSRGVSRYLVFVLDEQRLLRYSFSEIEMVDTKNVNKIGQGEPTSAIGIALTLDGQTVYVASETSVTAWDVSSGKLKADITHSVHLDRYYKMYTPLCPTREGVLIATRQSAVELWAHDLSECIRRWTNLPDVKQIITISEEQVAVVRKSEVQVLDTSRGELVSKIPVSHRRVITCNSKSQVLTLSDSLRLIDDTKVVWTKDWDTIPFRSVESAAFSPSEQFLAVFGSNDVLVLDAETGNTLSNFSSVLPLNIFHFITDEECAISVDLSVQLFNVKFGELLSVIDVETDVGCLAACPVNRLLVIGLESSTPNFKVVRVHLPRSEGSGNRKRKRGSLIHDVEIEGKSVYVKDEKDRIDPEILSSRRTLMMHYPGLL